MAAQRRYESAGYQEVGRRREGSFEVIFYGKPVVPPAPTIAKQPKLPAASSNDFNPGTINEGNSVAEAAPMRSAATQQRGTNLSQNQTLDALLKGRKIAGTHVEGDTLEIDFDDGWVLTVRTAGPRIATVLRVPIASVRRQDTTLSLDCADGRTMEIHTLPSTSASSGTRLNIGPSPRSPRYNGIMLRAALWDSLEESYARLLRDSAGRGHVVASRAWFFGAQMGEQTFITLGRGDRTSNARAVMGLTSQEQAVTRPQEALIAGRWFRPREVYAVILPKKLAHSLGVTIAAVSRQSAFVRYGGLDYSVVGILDNDRFEAIHDLDHEPLTPVDFIRVQKQMQTPTDGGSGAGGDGASAGKAGVREYSHLEPNTVFIMPYQTLMNFGGEVRSIAIRFPTREEMERVGKTLIPRMGLILFTPNAQRTSSVMLEDKNGVVKYLD